MAMDIVTNVKEESKGKTRFIPWAAILILLVAAFLYEWIQYTFVRGWEIGWQFLYEIPILLILGYAVYWTTQRILHLEHERRQFRERLAQVEQQANEATRRLSAVFLLRQQFLDAEDEKEVIEGVLPLSVELTGASGASFVPLDEHGQPMLAVSYGELPAGVSEAWVEYLASPSVHKRCSVCETHSQLSTACPLLKGPVTDAIGIYCLSLHRGEREYGVLNLYIPREARLDAETRAFIQSIVDETALALEGVWLRKRELGALRQLQAVRQKADLTSLLSGLLENVYQALEADIALLVIQGQDEPGTSSQPPQIREDLVRGELSVQARPFILGIVQGVLASGDPVVLGNISGDPASSPGLKAVLAAPLVSQSGSPLGALLVGNRRAQNFHQRHLTLLQTVAAQIALVVQNNRQLVELEYKTMIEERSRLAREIHDGLAQTLGFLKLQVAQMQNYLERGDYQRLQGSLRIYYQTLAEAYQDARDTIDGLRISPAGSNLQAWLPQMLEEFQENVGSQIQVSMTCLEVQSDLPSEVQAQLIRILQEALSNVRKHAGASHVWVSCSEQNGDLIVEIRDDGRGFAAEDVPAPSQHGLRGMRERVELIGADFQVISRPQNGTTIRVCLPVKAGEKIL
jgi:two-component system nitrate/nitrite sensor histidine kinase NarX